MLNTISIDKGQKQTKIDVIYFILLLVYYS